MMGRRKRNGNHSPHKNKLVQDSEGNEENEYPVPDSNKTKIDYPKEPNKAHKNTLKEEITENFMEILLEKVNQNVQEALKKFQDIKNTEYESTQKQISELIAALNKYQSETENTINRGLRMKIDNMEKEVTYDMENLRKKKKETNTKYNGRPLQQIRTNKRQNLRT
jgi:cell division protein FtsX